MCSQDNTQNSAFHRNAIHVHATNANIRCSMYSVISLSAYQIDETYLTQIWMLFPLHWACNKSDWYWKGQTYSLNILQMKFT